jgi:hypothetical protein
MKEAWNFPEQQADKTRIMKQKILAELREELKTPKN